MSTQCQEPADRCKASIVVKVFDKGGEKRPLIGALIGLYPITPASFPGSSSYPSPCSFPGESEYFRPHPDEVPIAQQRTDETGRATFCGLEEGCYGVYYLHVPETWGKQVQTRNGCTETVCLEPLIDASVSTSIRSADCKDLNCRGPQEADYAETTITFAPGLNPPIMGPSEAVRLPPSGTSQARYSMQLRAGQLNQVWTIQLPPLPAGQSAAARAALVTAGPSGTAAATTAPAQIQFTMTIDVTAKQPIPVTGGLEVSMTRTETEPTADLPLWIAIRNGTDALSFNNYLRFIDLLFCTAPGNGGPPGFTATRDAYHQLRQRRFLPFTDTDSYRVLKAATEAFVMVNCAVLSSPFAFNQDLDNAYLDRRDLPLIANLPAALQKYYETIGGKLVLPYLALIVRKLPDIPIVSMRRDDADLCVGFVQEKLASPCLIELIWSYWHEEGMLAQTLNAVTRRFQNIHSPMRPDPLANLEIDPLRPLNNLIWGYTQDEQHRLSVNRRNREYIHEYGLALQGKAVQRFRPADTRSQFLEAFHHLLRLCTVFFQQDDDTTVKADAFPVLNVLKEVHLVMSEGAHNQFGDLPSTARIEMLMQQWLLARPEFREFLPTRLMVAYPEPWMDRVDAMKKLQGWTDTSVVHFRNLAIFGEQLLLSIRYGAWSEVFEATQAFNWARFWRPQIQGYIHAYRAATGVDLSGDTGDAAADSTLPSLLLQRRLAVQRRPA
jgi:hypothetical protein